MNNISKLSHIVFGTALTCAACGPVDGDSASPLEPPRALAQPLAAPASLPRYALDVGRPTKAELGQRVQQIASALLAENIDASIIASALSTLTVSDVPAHQPLSIGGRDLSVHYDPEFGVLRVRNETAEAHADSTASDVGPDTALDIAVSTAKTLLGMGALRSEGLDLTSALVRKQIHGFGQAGQAPTEEVTAYIVTIPRIISGARVRMGNQEAGARISVHRSGSVVSVAIAGPTGIVAKGSVAPGASVDTASLVAKEYPSPNFEVEPKGLEYVLDAGDPRDAVVPRRTYFVVPVVKTSAGTTHGRGQFVSYTLHENVPSSFAWPKPDPTATGNAR